MTRIVAFIDDSPCASGVHTAARWLGERLGVTVDAIRVVDPARADRTVAPSEAVRVVRGPTIEVLLDELDRADVLIGVVGSRSIDAKRPVVGHVARSLLARSSVPLMVVPPEPRLLSPDEVRVLVPLDGSSDTAEALMPLAGALAEVGAHVVVAHVFDADSVPPFISSAHDLEILATEFHTQHLPGLCDRCELRVGEPTAEIIALTEIEAADAVLVAWHRDLSPGRAAVLRQLLRTARVPVIVVPIGTG